MTAAQMFLQRSAPAVRLFVTDGMVCFGLLFGPSLWHDPLGGLAFRSHKFVQGCVKAFKYLGPSPHSLVLVNPLFLPFTLAGPA